MTATPHCSGGAFFADIARLWPGWLRLPFRVPSSVFVLFVVSFLIYCCIGMHPNFLLRTDSYKFTHWKQYPAGTTHVYSYMESRGGMFPQTLFFGLQYYLKHYLQGPVFAKNDINEAEDFCRQHFGHDGYFNRAGWEYLLQKYSGRLPVKIMAVP